MGLAKVHCGATPPSVMVLFREKEAQNLLHTLPHLFQNYFLILHVSSKQVCMIGSTLFHTFLCHSPSVAQFWLSCDRVSFQCVSLNDLPSGRDPFFTFCHLPPGPSHDIPLPPSPQSNSPHHRLPALHLCCFSAVWKKE